MIFLFTLNGYLLPRTQDLHLDLISLSWFLNDPSQYEVKHLVSTPSRTSRIGMRRAVRELVRPGRGREHGPG